jgi:hypothetical protein
MTMPFEKRFLKKWFSHQISSKTPSPQEMEHRKKKRKKKEKRALRVFSNKRGSHYFERRKALQLQRSILMWFHFLPLHHTISKTLSKIIEKVFLALFDHRLAWQYTWLELYPFSLPMSSTYLAFRG